MLFILQSNADVSPLLHGAWNRVSTYLAVDIFVYSSLFSGDRQQGVIQSGFTKTKAFGFTEYFKLSQTFSDSALPFEMLFTHIVWLFS